MSELYSLEESINRTQLKHRSLDDTTAETSMHLVEVKNICLIGRKVYKVTLWFDECIPFLAGQYLKLWLNQEVYGSYSIACPGYFENQIDIFIGYNNPNSLPATLIKNLRLTRKAYISLPYGEAYYRHTNSEKIFIIVSGTGYAYGKSIILQALEGKEHKKIYFLWALRYNTDIFESQMLYQLKNKHLNFEFLISIEKRVESKILKNEDTLAHLLNQWRITNNSDIYLAGGSSMVKTIWMYLREIGINQERIYGDFAEGYRKSCMNI